MLVRMSGEQVGKAWPIIKAAVKASALPTADTNENKMKNVLRALLSGRAICWIDGAIEKPRTIIITTITLEEVSLTKNLLVYCAHGFHRASSQDYIKMVKDIGSYAKIQQCDNIIAYVWNGRLVDLFKKYGAEANYVLVTLPLMEVKNG